ncbi:thioredoxin domain-containing protein [Blautia coccoides]|uniref:thioredoxin domain-containing protein n=1 Tax=Blautia producta TaxID=33035 RepID=UPI00214A8A13|nr:thioredoxin domain-containing protein [Blautia coccoides]MCR1990076.1 thioredoxin domain-containing protein [Blautia coccoides]
MSSNHLRGQSSPYLIQHSENPVDWYPWCNEAFERARQEDKPVFLSIGYSTCHWCHVMAHESFENEEIAAILNQNFISIKVDREERPDIDSVYMAVCQTLTGSGGWPMSIFMTAEQKPFYAGTYFPPVNRSGMMGFRELLLEINKLWKQKRAGLLQSAEQIFSQIDTNVGNSEDKVQKRAGKAIDSGLPGQAAELFTRSFDKNYGGFGSAPKFPTPHNLIFLMLYSGIGLGDKWYQVEKTLEQMRRGGIFDHIGYGFSRYSTDRFYLVPHFEKMLYDNALLIIAYAAAFKISEENMFLDTAEKTAEYILREMTGSDGEFYSAQDADSEGREGLYYIWDYEEICNILGRKKGEEFCSYFGISERGNFEGKNIPNLLNGNPISDKFHKEKKLLYENRQLRTKLHLDDKVLTTWNSLMLSAMVVLYRVTGKERYLQSAVQAHCFIEKNLADGNILFVSCRNGAGTVNGFLDEYAYYTAALLSLYEAVSDEKYLRRAEEICNEARRQFEDRNGGGFFLYGDRNDRLITRPKETYDGAIPSGNSVMAYCLVRLFQITDNKDYKSAAEQQLAYMSHLAEGYPAGYCMFLTALLLYNYPPQKITAILSKTDTEEEIISRVPLYADIKILKEETPEFKLLNGNTTYYVCKDHICLPPVNEIK